MNKLRKVLISVFSVMLLVCLGLFAAACNGENEPTPAEKIYYTVTVAEYEETQGSVTLAPAAENGKYEENTSVTVTVTPNADYEVDAVKVNGSALTANSEGNYVFTVKGDTTVSVTFKTKTVTPPPADETVNITVDCGTEGSYTLDPAPVDGKVAKGASVTLTVTPDAEHEVESVKVNNSEVTANNEGKYVFTADADTTVEITFKTKTVTPPPADETVNITVTCGEEGSYTLDPAPVDGKVAKGASVTLTVTPDDGYAIYDVTVNGRPATKGEGEGVYTFTADADTSIVIKFKEDLSGIPDAGVEFGLTWQGTWMSQDETVTIVITSTKMIFNDTPVTGVTNGEGTSGQSYAFTTGGKSYQLEVANEAFSASSLLVLVSGAERTYIAHSFAPEIDQKYQGHWYATNSDVEMDITASEVTYNGTKATFVVDMGYVDHYGSGNFDGEENQGTPVNANIYIMLVGDNLYTLIWSDPYVSVGDTLFSKSRSSFAPDDPTEFIGEWEGITNPDYSLSIQTVDGVLVVKFNGEEVAVNLNAEFKHDGKEYDFTASENILILHENVYMEDDPNTLARQNSYLFVKKDCPELFVDEKDLLGTTWSAAGMTLTVSQEGKITINETVGKIISTLAHSNGVGTHSYTVVAGTDVYDVYHDTAATLYVESRSGDPYTLGNGQIEPQFLGTWNKNAVGTVGSRLVISQEEGCTFDGEPITLLRSGIIDGYVFTVTDDEGDSKTYTIQLLMDFEAYLLGVSYVENNATENAYYLKETTVPPVTIDDALVGLWSGSQPLDIYSTYIQYGPYKATVFANPTDTDSNLITYFVYVNGDLFFLIYNKTSKQIELNNYGSTDTGEVYASKTEHDMSVKLPDKFKGKWSDGNGNEIYVDSEGNLFYNGVQGILEASSNENVYSLTVSGDAWTVQYLDDGRLYWHYMQNIEQYFTKLVDVHGQILQWYTAGTLSETVANGNTVVVKGLFSGVVDAYGGFVVDINVNGAWYRLRVDPNAFGQNSSEVQTNTWTQPNDAMYDQLQIIGTEWDEAKYLALYADGGKAWVVAEATLLNNKLTYVVKTYKGTDAALATAVTTTTFVLTSTSPVDSLNIAIYCDKGTAEANVLEEAYVETTVRHSVTVDCAEGGSYTLSPDATNEKYYEEGTEVTLTVTAPQGKVVDSVKVNGSDVSATAGAYKFTVEADTTVVITFKDGDVGGDGVFTVEQQGKYGNGVDSYGTQLATTVVVEADSIYIFNSNMWFEHTFTGDEIVKTAEGEYTLTSADGSFTIKFQDDGSLYIVDEGYLVEGTQTLTKEGAVAGLFTDAQQGKYSDPSGTSPTTLEVTANSVIFNNGNCPLCSNGPYTFTGEELVKVSDNKYTLTASGSTFTIIFNDDGSVTFEDPAWAADGDANLTKGA